MKKKHFLVLMIVIAAMYVACDDGLQLMKNTPVGNPDLVVTGFGNRGVLREDTLTIYGHGFNPITYQNTVLFPASSVQEQWVNEHGEVTDSIVYRILQYLNPALVVDASPDSLKVIIPTAAVYGQVAVKFGVDTAASPMPYKLLTTELRPKILAVAPQFGSPGVSLNITVLNGSLEKERMVVSFGSYKAQPEEIIGGGITNIYIKVPKIFAGPVDMQIGKKIESGDTLWSTSVNFGITPGLGDVPVAVVTYNGDNAGTGLPGIVGYGEAIDGQTNLVELKVTSTAFEVSRGIAYNPAKGQAYWLDVGAPALIRGNIASKKGDTGVIGLGQVFYDVAFVQDGAQEYLYITGNQIRRLKYTDQFAIPTDDPNASKKIFPAGTPSANTKITNLEIVDKNFYWVDELAKKVMKGTLSADGLSLTNVETLYDDTKGLLTPFAIAVDESTNTLYITEYEGAVGNTVSKLVQGSTDGSAALTLIREYNKTGDYFYDLEIDLEDQYLYWANGRSDSDGGIYRAPLASLSTARQQIIYQFPGAQYFEINPAE